MSILRLKELLKEKSISGKELAEKVEVTENAISMIVNNKRQPRFELLIQIADILEVDIKDLFNSTKETERETQLYFKNDKGEFEKFGRLKLD